MRIGAWTGEVLNPSIDSATETKINILLGRL